jgi:hypothetical protein
MIVNESPAAAPKLPEQARIRPIAGLPVRVSFRNYFPVTILILIAQTTGQITGRHLKMQPSGLRYVLVYFQIRFCKETSTADEVKKQAFLSCFYFA